MADPIINAGGLLSTHFLEVSFLGVRYGGPDVGDAGPQRFSFHHIDCVLLSASNRLSLQVAKKTYTIPVKPQDPVHREVMTALMAGLERSGR